MRLAGDRVDAGVVHVATIKPLDVETIAAAADGGRLLVTLENHTVVGGIGESIAAALSFSGQPRSIVPIALPDEFLAAGALPTLHERYGLSVDRIVARVTAALGS